MPKAIDVSLEATLDAVMSVQSDVEAFCNEHDLSPRTGFVLNLILEELLTNVVNHGYKGAEGEPIALKIAHEGELIVGEIIDHGPAFDPTRLPPPDVEASIEEREIGGLGVYLSLTMTRDLTYARVGDTNVVRFTLVDELPPRKEETQ